MYVNRGQICVWTRMEAGLARNGVRRRDRMSDSRFGAHGASRTEVDESQMAHR